MKTLMLTASAIILIGFGCGSSKNSAQTDTTSSTATPPTEEAVGTATSGSQTGTGSGGVSTTTGDGSSSGNKQEDTKYRLIVSFISIGEGIDHEARKKMDQVIENWQNKTGKTIVMENYPWGREGEVDFCFHLKELSAQDQAAMAREMRTVFNGNQLIQISEFQPSMHKR
jgi:hypothetical protein